MLEAHTCYPDQGRFPDRIDRALRCGLPLAIHLDLVWHTDRRTQLQRQVIARGPETTGSEPDLEGYFFDKVRELVDRAMASPDEVAWPVLVLHLEFQSREPAHLAATWELLGKYESWLTTAVKTGTKHSAGELRWRPLLALCGDSEEQEAYFYDRVPDGGLLRIFGAVKLPSQDQPDVRVSALRASEFRRYVSLPWRLVEGQDPPQAGEWTSAEEARLRSLVGQAHGNGLWIRFSPLNGHEPGEGPGWKPDYNFGSRRAVEARWEAAVRAGVDFISTDQYEGFAEFRKRMRA